MKKEEKRKLKVSEIVKPLEAEILCEGDLDKSEIIGGYCSDLLSDCIANASDGSVWVTIHSHPNIIAVAVLVGMPCIVISNLQEVDPQTIEKAKKEKITLLRTSLTSYQAVEVLSKIGIHGTKKHP